MKAMTRREFMISGSVMVGAGAYFLAPGSGALSESNAHAAGVDFYEGKCGDEKNIGKRVLVVYASKYGSTGGVADAIGKELCGKDVAADVAFIKNAGNIRSYQGVIIGSAIYMGKWMSEATDFVKENSGVLCNVPVAYFLVGMTLAKNPEKRADVLSSIEPILKAVPEIKPVGIGTFAGAMDYNNLSWINKKILKSKGTPEGDFRDWNAIRSWAMDIKRTLSNIYISAK